MCLFLSMREKISREHILTYSNFLSPFSYVRIVQNLWLAELYKQIKKFKLVECGLFAESFLQFAYCLTYEVSPVAYCVLD